MGRVLAASAIAGILTSNGASAHSFGQVYTLPVPLWLYAWTAVAALVLSFVIAGIFLTGKAGAAREVGPPAYPHSLPNGLLRTLQVGSLGALVLCLLTGFLGTPQSLLNINMTLFWIVFVLGFAYLTALCGDLYALINPWHLLCKGIGRIWPAYARGCLPYPEALGATPAVILYGGFIWLELFGRSTPHSLAVALAGYTALNLLAAGLFGATAWFRHGEFFAVLLRLLARMAPLEFQASGETTTRRFRLRWPGTGLLDKPLESPGLLLFVLFMLSSTAFDGLHESRPWVQLFWTTIYRDLLSGWLGTNPIAAFPTLFKLYPWWQAFWLFAGPLLYLGTYLLAIECMRWLTGRTLARLALALRFAHSLLPIVLVYHLTHYYTLIQTQGVKIVALTSDPFGFGWNLFGTAGWMVSSSVPDTTVVWHVQVVLLLAGHIASVVVAHLEALRLFPDRRVAAVSQLPMLALMVAFTVFGLWILSLPLDVRG